MPSLSYRDVLDRYDRAKAFGDTRDLSTYSKDMNDLYDSQDFSAGLQDGWWKRASTRADQNFFEPIAHATTEPLLGAVGGMFGAEDVGRRVGLGLPRMVADTLPLFIPGLGEAYGGALAAGATGGLMAAHTYADTGSARNAAISGVTGAALPFLGHVGGALGLKFAGAPLARGLLTKEGEVAGLGKAGDFISKRLATTAPEFLSQYAGSQVALAAGQMASTKYENPDEDVFSKDFATQFLLGQIPFTALDVYHGAKALGTKIHLAADGTRTEVNGLPTREQVGLFTTPEIAKPSVESKPLVPREGTLEDYAKLDEIAAGYEKIVNDPNLDMAAKSAALANYKTAVREPAVVPRAAASPSDVIVQGYTNGRNRIVVDSYSGDQSKVPEHKTMVFYPDQVKDLQHFGNGEVAFKIAEDKINPAKYPLERPFRDPNVQELPVQEKPVEKVPFEQQLPKKKGTGGGELAKTKAPTLEGQPWETPEAKTLREIRASHPLDDEEKQTAVQMGARPEAILRISERIPKSADPILNSIRGAINLDPQGRVVRMGSTDIGVEGEMNERRFLKRTQMPKEFLEAAKEFYPEAFGKQGVVNVNELVKGLRERPMVETRRLDVSKQSEVTENLSNIEHELDTLAPDWRDEDFQSEDPRVEELLTKRDSAQHTLEQTPGSLRESESATARFSSVNPYPPEVLRGEKEVAPGERITWAGDVVGNLPVEHVQPGPNDEAEFKQTFGRLPDKEELALYQKERGVGQPRERFSSGHYPSDAGKNQLFFVRGALHEYQPGAKLPSGRMAEKVTKVFEVWEVQSDWAGERARAQALDVPYLNTDGSWGIRGADGQDPGHTEKFQSRKEAETWISKNADASAPNAPLLSHWESLAYTAAIQHARSLGADEIGLSDAPSAMMTEGHDKAAKWTVTNSKSKPEDDHSFLTEIAAQNTANRLRSEGFQNVKVEGPKVSQFPGMTAAYDVRGPKTLEKLTGVKGVSGDFGVHQNVVPEGESRFGMVQAHDGWEVYNIEGDGETIATKLTKQQAQAKVDEGRQSGSPVFKDAKGQPKTNNTARLFSLEKVSGSLSVDPTASIKEAVHAYEMARQRETDARAKIGKVPETAEEWAEDVRPNELKKLAEQGLSTTQALTQEKLVHAAKEVDEAMTEQEVAKEVVKQKTRAQYEGREKTQYSDKAVKDEDGARLNFKSESEAYAHRETLAFEEGRDPEDWALRNNGRGAYYLVEKLNRKLSLDIPETGGHERVGDTSQTQAEQDVEEGQRSGEAIAPEVDEPTTADIIKDKLRSLIQMRPEDAPPEIASDLAGAQEWLKKTELGESPTTEEQASWDKVRKKYLKMRKYDLGSTLPHDEKLVQEIGLAEHGPVAWLDWYVKNTPNPTDIHAVFIRELADLVRNSANKIKLTTEVKPGWSYLKASPTEPAELNARLPFDKEDALLNAPNMAHELAHHLTVDLVSRGDEKAKLFTGQLNEMIGVLEKSKYLPEKVRAAIKAAKAQGLYEKSNRYETDITQWFNDFVGKKNEKYMGLFYGLLHPEELVSQIFGSRDMLGLLAGTPRTQNIRERVLDWFSRAWKALSGIKAGTDNMLGQFLENFDDYLGKGSGYTGMDFIRDKLVSQGVRPEGLASRVQTVKDMLSTGRLASSVKGWEREDSAGTLPITSVFSPSLLDTSRTPGQLSKDILSLDPAFVPGHSDLIVRMDQDVRLAQTVAKKIAAGEIPGKLREGVLSSLGEASAQVNAMKKAMARYARDQQRFEGTKALDGSSWRQAIEGRMRNAVPPSPADPPANMDLAHELLGLATPMVPVETAAEVKARTGQAVLNRTKMQTAMKFLEDNVLLQQHLTRLHPAQAARNNVLQLEESNAHDRMQGLQVAYNWSDSAKGIDPKVIDNNVKVKNTERLVNTASAIRLVANEIVKRGEKADWDHAEIQAIAKTLSPADRESVKTEYESAKRRYDMSNNLTWPKFYDDAIPLELAQTIAARDGVLPDSARAVARDTYQTLRELRDPQTAATAVEKLRALMTKLSPDTVLKIIDQGNAAIQKADEHIAFLKSRSHYTSEQRYGAYHASMLSSDNKPIRVDGKSVAEVREKVRQKEGQGARLIGVMPKEDANAQPGTSTEVLNKLEELETQRQARQAAALDGLDPITKATLLDPAGLAQELRTSLEAMKPLPGVARKFREGRESLNMLENDDAFYLRQNNYMRHKLTRAGDQLERLHPEVAGNLELKKYGDQMLEAFLTPDNPLARRLTSLVFFNKLAFEFGNTVLESLQHLTTGMQQLISETGSVGDAFDLTQKASKSFWKAQFSGKWENPDQEWLVQRMKATGHDIQSSWNDIHDPNTIALRTANSGKTMAGRAVSAIDNLSKSFSSKAQGYGNYIGMLSAFDHGLSQGMTRDEAFNYAADSKNQGMYTGGKGQRPGLWRIKTKAIPQIMTSLQTYTLGWFGQMYTDYIRGFSKNRPQGLTRSQIEGSKKAFLYGLAVQATLAGALGLPGVGQGMALLQQATGVDLKGWVRGNMQSLFDEDQASGGGITAIAMNGLLAGTTPFDPSGRASVSLPFTGVDNFKGFDIANLAGAPVATLEDYAKGLASVAGGDRTGWEKVLPNFLKRPARLAMDEGDVKDSRGGLLYQMSPAERGWTLLGLPPSRIQRARDVAQAAKNANDRAVAKQQGLADSLATMFDKQGPAAVQQKLVELKQAEPDLDLRQLVKQIADRRVRQTTPFDWRREVNPASELQGLSVYNPSTVAQGRATSQQTQAALGLRPTPNPQADMEALAIDQLLNSGAAKTEAEARKMLRRGRPQMPLAIPGLP